MTHFYRRTLIIALFCVSALSCVTSGDYFNRSSAYRTNDSAMANYTAEDYYNQGMEHDANGNFTSAITSFSEAIRLNPTYADAYYNRGIAYFNYGVISSDIHRDWDRAITDFTNAIYLNPNHADAYTKRGFVHELSGNKSSAIADYEAALSIDPNHLTAKEYLENLRGN